MSGTNVRVNDEVHRILLRLQFERKTAGQPGSFNAILLDALKQLQKASPA